MNLFSNTREFFLRLCLPLLGAVWMLFGFGAEACARTEETDWFVDRYHEALSSRLTEPILWLDDFFGDRQVDDLDQATMLVRWRSSVRIMEGEGVTLPQRLRARARLPHLSERLHLLFEGDDLKETCAEQIGVTAGECLSDPDAQSQASLGLMYLMYDSLRDRLDVSSGARLRWPADYYVRLGYERLLHLGRANVVRLSETGVWRSLEGYSATSRVDLDRRLSDQFSSRFSLYVTWNEDVSGIDWGGEASLYQQLSSRSALSFDLGMYGDNRPSTVVETYRAGCRYRSNFFRPWLFWAVEPEVRYVLDDDGRERNMIQGITFSIEVLFSEKDWWQP